MGRFYHNSDGFLMLCVQNVWVEPILISQNPIFTEFVMLLVSPPLPLRWFATYYRKVNEGRLIIYHYQECVILANSADPDETPQNAASHLSLRCLYMVLVRMHSAWSTSAFFEFETSYAPVTCTGQSVINSIKVKLLSVHSKYTCLLS